MSDEVLMELEHRFTAAARGRAVLVRFEPKDFILVFDYKVRFDADTKTFEVVLRRGGCFEGAYRCVERSIEASAEQLDGMESAPPGHLDLRLNMEYWMLERIYEQFRSDIETAVNDRISWLERVRPGDDVLGEVVIETRTRSLVGLLAHLQSVDGDVRRAILSRRTIEVMRNIGLDVFSEAG